MVFLNNIVNLISDFDGYYLSILKGLILSKNKNINIIDSARIENYNILSSIFFLITSLTYFDKGVLFVVLVDPYPLSNDYLLCDYGGYYIVGPNNGCFSPFIDKGRFYLVNKNYIDEYRISNDTIMFWGKIINSILSLRTYQELNLSIYENDRINFIEYKPLVKENLIEGKIFYIDGFGNIITNIENSYFERINYLNIGPLNINKSIDFKNIKKVGFIRGSQGFIEIVGNKNSAKDILNIDSKQEIIIRGLLSGE